MSIQIEKLDQSSNLILHRTSREEIEQGMTVITRGEGIYVYDQDGKRHINLDSGVTRPVNVGLDHLCLGLERGRFTREHFLGSSVFKIIGGRQDSGKSCLGIGAG